MEPVCGVAPGSAGLVAAAAAAVAAAAAAAAPELEAVLWSVENDPASVRPAVGRSP